MYPEQKIAQFVCRFEHSVAARMAYALHARREPHDSSYFPSSEIVCGDARASYSAVRIGTVVRLTYSREKSA
jgi:hypothetical protein